MSEKSQTTNGVKVYYEEINLISPTTSKGVTLKTNEDEKSVVKKNIKKKNKFNLKTIFQKKNDLKMKMEMEKFNSSKEFKNYINQVRKAKIMRFREGFKSYLILFLKLAGNLTGNLKKKFFYNILFFSMTIFLC